MEERMESSSASDSKEDKKKKEKGLMLRKSALKGYIDLQKKFIKTLRSYFTELNKLKPNLNDDLNTFAELNEKEQFEYLNSPSKHIKSKVGLKMYECSPKMFQILFRVHTAKGPTLIYSQRVKMEGIEIMSIYFYLAGYSKFDPPDLDEIKDSKKGIDKTLDIVNKLPHGHRIVEYHGELKELDMRQRVRESINHISNIKGTKIRAILMGAVGAEGLNLENIRQVHVMEPYWHEIRIEQVIGRAIRFCSHKNLPLNERYVDIYRYISVRSNNQITSDQEIDELAQSKLNLNNSFLDSLKEVAIDCKLFKNEINLSMDARKLSCFQFDNNTLLDKQKGLVYREKINDDIIFENKGSNSKDYKEIDIDVVKVTYIVKNKKNKPRVCWLHEKTGHMYDFETHDLIGKNNFDLNGLPEMENNHYILSVDIFNNL